MGSMGEDEDKKDSVSVGKEIVGEEVGKELDDETQELLVGLLAVEYIVELGTETLGVDSYFLEDVGEASVEIGFDSVEEEEDLDIGPCVVVHVVLNGPYGPYVVTIVVLYRDH